MTIEMIEVEEFNQGTQKKDDPRLPVRRVGANRALSLAQGQVVALFVLLDDAFERTVRHVGIASL